VNRAWTAKLLRSALVIPVLVTLGLPGSFSVVSCRFGAMTQVHACCRGRALRVPAQARVAGERCCSVRAVDLGTPLAEHPARVVQVPETLPSCGWALMEPGPAVSPAARGARPLPRAVGPPLRLLKQSFLI
jgi:hypothetical protein